MKITADHKLSIDAGENYIYKFNPSPNRSDKPLLPELSLIIHAPGSASVAGAESQYLPPFVRSKHLIIGSDGMTIIQLVPFNVGALHTQGYDGRSIAIELEYPGQLVDGAPSFDKSNKLNENEYILGSSISSSHYSQWPLYPKKQIDLLLTITKLLKQKYKITEIIGRDEAAGIVVSPHPGPAFPIIHFREKILGSKSKSLVLQELAKPVRLLGQPGKADTLVFNGEIPADTPVSVLNEKDNWYLIAVIEDVEKNPWLVGWVRKNAVRVQTEAKLSVKDHYLVDEHGRRFQEITPHKNGYKSKPPIDRPRFVVMHFTTGTKIESTVSHFIDGSSGVSTHLLIGRDGRVIQFLPFNKVAQHCGYSYWERLSNLNYYSIGIELDNAGLLSRSRDTSGWVSRKVPIPDDMVQQKVSWKQFKASDPKRYPAWEKFTKVQLKVALNIVKALKEHYDSITDILGHEDVNINNRYDPGPLFPMAKFREELFGRKDPEMEIFKINEDKTHLYANSIDGSRPNTNTKTYNDTLPIGSIVRVNETDENRGMSLVRVEKLKVDKIAGKQNKKSDVQANSLGWVSSGSLALIPGAEISKKEGRKGAKVKPGKKQKKEAALMEVKAIGTFFKRSGQTTPTPFVVEGPFKKGTPVRIEKLDGEWALVVVMDRSKGRAGIEGWIRTNILSPEVVP